MVGDELVDDFVFDFFLGVCWCLLFCGKGRAAGTGPPHPLGVLIGHLIAGKDGLGSTAGCVG